MADPPPRDALAAAAALGAPTALERERGAAALEAALKGERERERQRER
jgi:hypothetical protein